MDDCAARELEGVFVEVSSLSVELLMLMNIGIVSGVSCPSRADRHLPNSNLDGLTGCLLRRDARGEE